MAAKASPTDYADHTLESARDATQKIKLGALYADKPVVMAFLRRMGCQICRIQVRAGGREVITVCNMSRAGGDAYI